MTDIAAQKTALRVLSRQRRAGLPADFRHDAAQRLAGRLIAETILPPGVIAGYWPLGDEIDPRPLLRALAAQGREIALPVTGPQGTPLVFRRWTPEQPLIPGRFGVLAPADDQPELSPRVILAPLLAFDRAGGRLGYGGGYYDRTLAGLYREARPVTVIGLAYSVQEEAAVPLDPFDCRLDGVATENGVIAISGGAGPPWDMR